MKKLAPLLALLLWGCAPHPPPPGPPPTAIDSEITATPPPLPSKGAPEVTSQPDWFEPWLRSPLVKEEATLRENLIYAINNQRTGVEVPTRVVTVLAGAEKKPVAGALVYSNYTFGFTDGNGQCLLASEPLPVGEEPVLHNAAVFKPGMQPYFSKEREDFIHLEEGGKVEVSGRILESNGKPAAKARVRLLFEPNTHQVEEEPKDPGETFTDAGGHFQLTGAGVAGTFTLQASRYNGGYAQSRFEHTGSYSGDLRLNADGSVKSQPLKYSASGASQAIAVPDLANTAPWSGPAFQLTVGGMRNQVEKFPPYLHDKTWYFDSENTMEQHAFDLCGKQDNITSGPAEKSGSVLVIDGQTGKPLQGALVYDLFDLGVTGSDGSVKGKWHDNTFIRIHHPDFEPSVIPFAWAITGKPIALSRLGGDRIKLVVKKGLAAKVGLAEPGDSETHTTRPVLSYCLAYALAHSQVLIASPLRAAIHSERGGATVDETYDCYPAGNWSIPIPRVNWIAPHLKIEGVAQPIPYNPAKKRVEVSIEPPAPEVPGMAETPSP